MPLSFVSKKAEAQYNISGYATGLIPAIARLPQCKNNGGVIKNLFNGITGLFSGETGGAIDEGSLNDWMDSTSATSSLSDSEQDHADAATTNLDLKVTSGTIKSVSNPGTAETNRLLQKIDSGQQKLNKTTQKINEDSSCIASVGRLIAKMFLQKLTVSTVKWINSGFDGSPSFLQNPGKFFNDIAKNEILQFGIEIQDSPFGKDWLRNQALAYKTKFSQNAQYSLNKLIQETNPEASADKFQSNFSMGGWDAWTALTQIPANNPIGAKIMFDNEIQKRLDETSQSTAKDTRDAIQAANGFLGDYRCSVDSSMTQTQKTKALEATNSQGDPCIAEGGSWEYVTPGKMIADYATEVTKYQNNSLLNVEDLNDAVAAMLDATLNQFSTNIFEKGFANIGNQGIDGALVFSGATTDPYKTQTEKDYTPSQLTSSWLQANPDFNIRTDLTQALIDEQRTYSDKLALQNKELYSTTDGKDYNLKVCPTGWSGKYPNCKGSEPVIKISTRGISFDATLNPKAVCPTGWSGKYPDCIGPGTGKEISNAYGLIPAIYQLDYCIPGPHPGWENDSRDTLNSISIGQAKTSSNEATGVVNGVVGVGLNFVPYVGPALSSLFGALTGDVSAKDISRSIRGYYTDRFYEFTGFRPQAPYDAYASTDPVHVNMTTSEGVSYVLNSVLNRYVAIMNKTYFSSPDRLPSITKEAANDFDQLPGYNQMIKDNNDKIISMKSIVGTLGDIKDAVDNLNNQLDTNQISNDDYENELKTQIYAFGRLSASMVNGDDIASASDLVEQIIAKKNRIYNNLLKGPYGCEAFLQNLDNVSTSEKNFPSAGSGVKQPTEDWNNYNVNSVARMTYPFPILYDYNNFDKGAPLPDPWGYNKKCTEKDTTGCYKMPAENQYDKYGPGFLSFVHYTAVYPPGPDNIYDGAERLPLDGLIYNYQPDDQSAPSTSAHMPLGNSKDYGGLFEKTIGIY